MSAIVHRRTFSLRRIVTLTMVVFLSIALPVGIICWSVLFAMSGKPLGRPSSEGKNYQGVLKNREFWYRASRYVGKTREKFYERRIERLNVETGIETAFEITNDFYFPLWVDTELYGKGDSIYRKVDGAFIKIGEFPAATTPSFCSKIFPYDGRLTTVMETKNGEFMLCHLVDGQWIEGREFPLPAPGSVWLEDPQRGFKLSSPKSSQRPKPAENQRLLYVIQHEQDVHIFLCENNGRFAAYRMHRMF